MSNVHFVRVLKKYMLYNIKHNKVLNLTFDFTVNFSIPLKLWTIERNIDANFTSTCMNEKKKDVNDISLSEPTVDCASFLSPSTVGDHVNISSV